MSNQSATQTAVITGASRGLGLTLATFLAQQGWNLILTARDGDALQRAVVEKELTDLAVQLIPGDLGDATHRREVAAAVDTFEHLDLLVNNASTLGPTPLPRLADVDLGDLSNTFHTNVVGQLGMVQVLLPALTRSGGLVVNLSSDAARGGYPGWGVYGASKAALDLVGLTLAHELGSTGVAVVNVDPGDMRTTMHQAAFPGEDIGDRPLPDVTLPFWAWLLNQSPSAITGQRFEAQATTWDVQYES